MPVTGEKNGLALARELKSMSGRIAPIPCWQRLYRHRGRLVSFSRHARGEGQKNLKAIWIHQKGASHKLSVHQIAQSAGDLDSRHRKIDGRTCTHSALGMMRQKCLGNAHNDRNHRDERGYAENDHQQNNRVWLLHPLGHW